MARRQDPATRSQRLISFATIGLLAFATAFAFGRIFEGREATWKLIVAALASAGIAVLMERRGLFLALLASAAGLALVLTWLVYPQTAWYGLPTMRTLRAVGRSLEFVGQQARVQVAPTPPLPPLMLAAMTAVWAAVFSAHALAVRAGSPILAVLPPAALVGFADIVLEDGVRPVYAIVFLVAALAVVFADGTRRIRQWGPLWSPPYQAHPLSSPSGRGVRRVALFALAVAVLAPGLLPGFRSAALVDFSSTGDETVGVDPFVSIQASLERDAPVDLLQVTSEGGSAYWRMYALDRYDGGTWRSSDPELQRGQELGTPAQLPSAYALPPDAPTLSQGFRVLTDLKDRWLPMAYPARAVTLASGSVTYDAELGVARASEDLEQGFEYAVTSAVVSPTPEQLDQITFGAPAEYGQYTYLPGDVDPRVRTLAEAWTANATTPYRKVLALQQRFLSGAFTYSIDVEPNADADALLTFLTRTRTGFCQQFSTAMAVLVRELGYPARVVVGFRPGSADGDVYTVRTNDAHSWVEVLFPGYGWLPFEPTPGRSNPIATPGSYLNPAAPASPGEEGQGGQGANAGGGGGLPGQLRNTEFLSAARRGGGGGVDLPPGVVPAPDEGGYDVPYVTMGAILLGILLVLAIGVPITKLALRRRTLRRARDPRALVLATFRVFDGEAADLGWGRAEGETLAEYERRLVTQVPFSNGHLGRLTAATARAAYAERDPEPDEARAAGDDARTAMHDLRKEAGIVRRLTGIYRPRV